MGVVCTAGRPLTRTVPSHEWSRLLKCLISPFKKIHTNTDGHAHSHTLTWYPRPTTPISRAHRYPAHHPSLYAALSKQMRSWFKLELPRAASSPSAASIPFLKSQTSVQHLCLCISGCMPSPHICHSYGWPPVTMEICLYERFCQSAPFLFHWSKTSWWLLDS